jgi:hypothetical protein
MIPKKNNAGSLRNPAFLRRLLALLGLCGLITQNASALNLGTGADEVWFAPTNSGGAGSGTLADPYDGGGDKLRSWFSYWRNTAGRTNMTIHLLPGLYWSIQTNGSNLVLPLNSRLIGSGMTNTIIRQMYTTNAADGYYEVLQADYPSGYAYVSDLTLDANWGGSTVPGTGKGQCLWFTSGAVNGAGGVTNAIVERVHCIGWGSTNGTPNGTNVNALECYVVNYQPPTNGVSSFTMTDCIVEGGKFTGSGYGDCVTIYPNGAVPGNQATNCLISIRNNRFLNAPKCYGVYASGANGVIEDNEFNSLWRGVYIDTGYGNRQVVRNNRGINVSQGVVLNAASYGNGLYNGTADWLIENNIFEVSGDYNLDPSNFPTAGVHLKGWATNIVIRNNIITAFKPYQGTYHSTWYGVYMDGNPYPQYNSLVGTAIYNNSIGADLNNLVLEHVVTYCANNRVQDTELLPYGFPLWQGLYMGVTTNDAVITADMLKQGLPMYLAGFPQFYATNQGVVLPKPSDVPGRRFVLHVYKTSYSSPTYANCPLKISGQTNTSRTLSTDPSAGASGNFSFDATRNQDQYFFFPSQNAFANWLYLFDSTTTSGQNARMASVDLYSNGYNWFIMNR